MTETREDVLEQLLILEAKDAFTKEDWRLRYRLEQKLLDLTHMDPKT